MSSVLKGKYSKGGERIFKPREQCGSVEQRVICKRTGGCLELLECRTWAAGWWELRLKKGARAMS